ncbi:SGNH/GDSL hydrolase family protein [Phytoactinopolyspora endophytica]|uniref:SGNH/GDSL hydrolase family protein n=1 Tax=Phytoactinopolyspora endophytica TaxID=1642495 RepID=UPI00101D7EEF|nr:SGNH/GDSL hydrolase family protein [Phytoactinopolyspora endophytica]
MPERTIRPNDPALRWAGAITVEHTPHWSRAWRVPHERLDLFPGDGLRNRAAAAAGVRICFATDSTTIAGRIVPGDAPNELSPIDLVVDGSATATTAVIHDDRFAFTGLPATRKNVELWLPQFGEFRLQHLSLDAGATVQAARPAVAPKLITYGSSITHCRAAASPTRTWPAILARTLGVDLTCLGYGGQAHLDPMIARMIRDLPADIITTCFGINVYGGGTFNTRSFLPAVLGFLTTIRDGHPDIPILVISPIYSPGREDQPGASGMTLKEIRDHVKDAVHLLHHCGDPDIHLLNGLDVLGPEHRDRLFDNLHPDAHGYELMADKITPVVRQLHQAPRLKMHELTPP